MTLAEMESMVCELKMEFREALFGSRNDVKKIMKKVLDVTSSDIEVEIIIENLKEVYEDFMKECWKTQ